MESCEYCKEMLFKLSKNTIMMQYENEMRYSHVECHEKYSIRFEITDTTEQRITKLRKHIKLYGNYPQIVQGCKHEINRLKGENPC